jgi:hypothetical protein
MCNTAVLLIIFNRVNTTQKVFEAIRLAQPKRLYIAADGPRHGNSFDEENCLLTRLVTEHIDWPCEVKRLYQEKNLGCSKGPISAFNWFFSFENEGIILEDDCLPSESFFPFCGDLLERYRYDEEVLLISGCNMGYNLKSGCSYGFSGVPNMWGWATWKRSAVLIDYELKSWKQVKNKLTHTYKSFRQSFFDTDINWYRYWVDKFDRTVEQQAISWWDWQWIYYQTTNHKLSIFPAQNLVKNIGFDSDATHTKETSNPAADLKKYELSFPLLHPSKKKRIIDYEENCLKWTLFYHKRLPWHFHLRHSIKSWVLLKIKSNNMKVG